MNHDTATIAAESKIWACPNGCGYHIADGPVLDGEPSTLELIQEHLDEHDREAASAPVALTDELAKVLALVAAATDGYVTDVDDDAVAVLVTLGLIREVETDDPTVPAPLFTEPAGTEALFARKAAVEAAARKKVADSYAALVAELHAIADAIGSMPTDGLLEVGVVAFEIQPRSVWPRSEDGDRAMVATVDAVTGTLLAKPAVTERLGSSDTWHHEAKGRCGPVNVKVYGYIEDPSARLREQAERDRVAEMERLRTELAEANARLAAAGAVGWDADALSEVES